MDAFAERIETLKKMLITEENFHNVIRYFLDNLGQDREFIRYGKPAKSKILKDILKMVKNDICGEGGAVTSLKTFRAGKGSFLHGVCFLNGIAGTIIFFEDLDMGMIVISKSLSSGDVTCIRFSATTIESRNAAHFAGFQSKSIH